MSDKNIIDTIVRLEAERYGLADKKNSKNYVDAVTELHKEQKL